ncbi:hypothetical protein LS482_02265 [Sinomicrobium kalidii]|uniref:transposase n=1 Tax=Sinomicrobium kalidii TaxID=2900738 RepID=UPI001E43D94E|nr:transposase [Sinomicrobium kalidii]UGU16705.1 hypothetical protein LS482_02265 [Sinomicrobium kalidii]
MKRFNGKYRFNSNRMPRWDYSGKGTYFITLVVQGRRCIFGHIENGEVVKNRWGEIAYREWYKSFKIRKELTLDSFVLMPNHIHAVVTIDPILVVETHGRASQTRKRGRASQSGNNNLTSKGNNSFYRRPRSLSTFIAGYKSSVTIQLNNWIDRNISPALFPELEKFSKSHRLWQPNYHDRVIRDPYEYSRILKYIENNPKKWEEDQLHNNHHLSI